MSKSRLKGEIPLLTAKSAQRDEPRDPHFTVFLIIRVIIIIVVTTLMSPHQRGFVRRALKKLLARCKAGIGQHAANTRVQGAMADIRWRGRVGMRGDTATDKNVTSLRP